MNRFGENRDKLWAAAVAGVVLLGGFLRFYHLGAQSLWLDEGVSVKIAGLNPGEIIRQASADPTPPLYYLLLHYWSLIFGDSDFALRAPSAISGTAAVFVIYRVGTLLLNRTTGLLAAILLATSGYQVFYSQEVRAYGFFSLFVLLSMWFFIKLALQVSSRGREPTGRATLAGYVAFTSLMMYAHVYGVFVVAAQGLYLLGAILAAKRSGHHLGLGLKGWFFIQGALAVLYIPGLFFLVAQITRPQGRAWVDEPTLTSLARFLVVYAGSVPIAYVFVALAALPVALILLRFVDARLSPGQRQRRGVYLLVLWLLAPVVLPFVVSKVWTPILGHDRHVMAASFALYLLAAKGIESLARGAYRQPVFLAAGALILALGVPNVLANLNELDREQWREATSYVDAHAHKGDLVVSDAGYDFGLLFTHYSDRKDLDKESLPADAPQLPVGSHERVWTLLYDSDAPRLADGSFEKDFREVHHKKYRGIDLTLFERKDSR